ncbi:MAG: hypothetical protein OXD54_14645 [Candidatus Poribacteria bacterium]|nr:hypothetical protein [Candidatus Poribacteria bacterium]
MNMYDLLNIDLKKVRTNDFIKFLRLEMPIRNGFGTVRFGRVRYALNGDQHKQENGLPIDLGKGIFLATLEDDELGEITREELEKTLQQAAIEIVQTVRKELDPPAILKSILKDYAYLKYDEKSSEPPNLLRCSVDKPDSQRQVKDIFEIARRLSAATGVDYKLGSYGGSSSEGDNLDEVWTRFSLRNFNFEEKCNDN